MENAKRNKFNITTKLDKVELSCRISAALRSEDEAAVEMLKKISICANITDIVDETLSELQSNLKDETLSSGVISFFGSHFKIITASTANQMFEIISKRLNDSLTEESSFNETLLLCEFINKTNLLSNAFKGLSRRIIKDVPKFIQQLAENDKEDEVAELSYAVMSLVLINNEYSNSNEDVISAKDYFETNVMVESMKDNITMALIAVLASNESDLESNESMKWVIESFEEYSSSEIHSTSFKLTNTIFVNHFEYFADVLPWNIFSIVFIRNLRYMILEENINDVSRRFDWSVMSKFAENGLFLSLVNDVIMDAIMNTSIMEQMESLIPIISDLFENGENEKEIKRLLIEGINIGEQNDDGNESTNVDKQVIGTFRFISDITHIFRNDNENLIILSVCILLNYIIKCSELDKLLISIIEKNNSTSARKLLYKTIKSVVKKNESNRLKTLNGALKECIQSEDKVSDCDRNQSTQDVVNVLNGGDFSEVKRVLMGVHQLETKMELFEHIVEYVNDIDSKEQCVEEFQIYNQLIKIYSNTNLEHFCINLIISKMSSGSCLQLLKEYESTNEKESDDEWFNILNEYNILLQNMITNAKNTIVKKYAAIYCQLYKTALKNTQKYLKKCTKMERSGLLSDDERTILMSRRFKLSHDAARIVDLMKTSQSYFSMIAGSVIADGVFDGALTLLAMSKLHSLCDRNITGLLATNLPALEKIRYRSYFPIISSAGKKIN